MLVSCVTGRYVHLSEQHSTKEWISAFCDNKMLELSSVPEGSGGSDPLFKWGPQKAVQMAHDTYLINCGHLPKACSGNYSRSDKSNELGMSEFNGPNG